MTSLFRWMAGGSAVVCAALLVGCDDYPPTLKTSPEPAAPSSEPGAAGEATRSEKRMTGPELTDEDKALIAAQKVCPVSGEELGSMGPPVKVTVKDETFFLCCPDCKKKVDADPDKYIAKVRELRKPNAGDDKSRDEAAHDIP